MKTKKSVLNITQNITAVDFTLASSRIRAENNHRALRWCRSAQSDVHVKTHLRGFFVFFFFRRTENVDVSWVEIRYLPILTRGWMLIVVGGSGCGRIIV